MRIALIGYGKMGKMIESIALQQGHDIVLRISSVNLHDFTAENLSRADVAIEFTNPHAAYDNVIRCLDAGVPVVCGSTGWNEKLDAARSYCTEKGGAFLHASNFSIGVNIFFELNKVLARLMNAHPGYEVSLHEVHHTQKKDAPSGTAVTLAEGVMEALARKKIWVNGEAAQADELSITSERTDPAPGTHHVRYRSPIDDIEIIHTAHSREGFAAGAVLAAAFLAGKKGLYTMKDVLQLPA